MTTLIAPSKTKREFSAGGLVIRKDGHKLFWLVSQHSQHKGWVFPKGLIGDHIEDEKEEATAIREVEEETGAKGKILIQLTPVKYFYSWKGEKRHKTVQYYIMSYQGGDIKKHDHEMTAVEWLPTQKVKERLTYKSDTDAFDEALKLIKNKSLKHALNEVGPVA